MPKGPLGLPRLTDIPPFTEAKADEELLRDEEDWHMPKMGVMNTLAEEGVVSETGFRRVELLLTVRDRGETVHTIFRDEDQAEATYIYNGDVAVIGKIEVKPYIRGRGVGTRMVNILMEDMKDNGVTEVYSVVASEGGRALLDKVGFTEDSPHMRDDDSVLYKEL